MACHARAPSLRNRGLTTATSGTRLQSRHRNKILTIWDGRRIPDGILAKDGKTFSFTVITNQGNEERLKAAQIIKEQLKRVGIDMNIKVLEWQAMLHEFIDKKRFEAIIMGWGSFARP